jgi:hypothetical protein
MPDRHGCHAVAPTDLPPTAMTAAQMTAGMLMLALGTVVIGYCVFADMAGTGPERSVRLWERPLLLIPLALVSIFLGSLLIRNR